MFKVCVPSSYGVSKRGVKEVVIVGVFAIVAYVSL